MNSRYLGSLHVLILLFVVGCNAKVQTQNPESESGETTQDVAISIDSEQRIFLDGVAVSLMDLHAVLAAKLGENKANFEITVAPSTPMGLVSDVQQQLPPENVASVRYPGTRG